MNDFRNYEHNLAVLNDYQMKLGQVLAFKNDRFVKVGFLGILKRAVSRLFGGRGFSDCKRDFIAGKINEFIEKNRDKLDKSQISALDKKFEKLKISILEQSQVSKIDKKIVEINTNTQDKSPISSIDKKIVEINNTLVEFYSNGGVDSEGRTLAQLHNLSGERKETLHNYIQWMFPTITVSNFNSKAPILNDELLNVLKSNPVVIENLKQSFKEIMTFYGFKYDVQEKKVHSLTKDERNDPAIENKICPKKWFKSRDHNLFRLTRILECLNLFGLTDEANALFSNLRSMLTELEKNDPETFAQFKKSYSCWKTKMSLDDDFKETLFIDNK